MPLRCKPEYINKHDINFFFTEGVYIDNELYVPYKQVMSAINNTEVLKAEETKRCYNCAHYDKVFNVCENHLCIMNETMSCEEWLPDTNGHPINTLLVNP